MDIKCHARPKVTEECKVTLDIVHNKHKLVTEKDPRYCSLCLTLIRQRPVLPLIHLTLMFLCGAGDNTLAWWVINTLCVPSDVRSRVRACPVSSVMQIALVNPFDRYPRYWGPSPGSHADPRPCDPASDQQVPALSSSHWPVLIFIPATVIIRIICLTLWSRAL